MITISRTLAKQLRGVFRRMLPRSPNKADQTVQFVAGEDGLRARLCNRAGAVEYHLAGNSLPESLAVTLDALSACEGTRGHENASLEACTDGGVIVRWDDRSIPRSIVADAPPNEAELPALPTSFATNPPRLLSALRDAMETTEHDSMRYATNCVQLRGNDGRIAATDGGQVLCESGFTFPWEDEVLVLRPSVFASRDLPTDQAVEVGRTEHHIAVRIGPWTFFGSTFLPRCSTSIRPRLARRAAASRTDCMYLRQCSASIACATSDGQAVCGCCASSNLSIVRSMPLGVTGLSLLSRRPPRRA